MKHLVPFRVYESKTTSGLTKKQEAFLNRYIGSEQDYVFRWFVKGKRFSAGSEGTWSVNPTTGLVDIRGSFNFVNKRAKSFFGVKFGNVTGHFNCSGNQLQSLEGAPREVVGHFDCRDNQLQTLKGSPREVGRGFNCSSNDLKSLEGAPQEVNGNFNCLYNPLQTLAGAPKEINGEFRCDKFQLESGEWNLDGWVKILQTGSKEAKKLILTLPYLQPDWLNMELQRDPGKTVHLLASCWKDLPEDMKSKIKIPSGYEDEFDLFSEFDELGLF